LIAVIDDKGWVSAWDATERSVDYEGFAVGLRNQFWNSVDFYLLNEQYTEECLTSDGEKISIDMLMAFIQSPEFANRTLDPRRN
jgi:hypothetical protein